jgi:diaminopimelate decarboxylase
MRLQGTMQINNQGHLEIGGCDVVGLADTFGTPLMIIDEDLLRDNCRRYYKAFTQFYSHLEIPHQIFHMAHKSMNRPFLIVQTEFDYQSEYQHNLL